MDEMREVIDGCINQRRIQGAPLHPHGIVDLGEGRDFAYVPFPVESLLGMGMQLWALGAMCKREKAPRVYIAVELVGRLCHTEEEAEGMLKKYPDPREMPLDDQERYLIISEVIFGAPQDSRLARIPVRGLGQVVSFDAAYISYSHVCKVFHPVLMGWQSGQMPPGVNMVSEDPRYPEDMPEGPPDL